MARITRRASSSCDKGDAYATVSLASVWSAEPGSRWSWRWRCPPPRRPRGSAGWPRRRQTPRRRRADKTSSARPGCAAGGARPGGRRHGSLFAPRWNMFQLGAAEQRLRRPGALAALSGPSRWPAVHRGACCMNPRLEWHLGRRQRRLARFALFSAATSGSACSKSTACGMRFRSSTASTRATAFTGAGGVLLLDDDAATSGEPQRVPLDLAAIRPARAPRRRHVSRHRHTHRERRRHWRLYDDQALRRAAVGGELRVQQRQRGGAALPIPHERHGRRPRVDE